jgi:hypothetical protein
VQQHANAPIVLRRATPRQSLRTVAGSALRRGSFIQRVLHLTGVLGRVEALAARLAHRRRIPFTRLRAITPIAMTYAAPARPRPSPPIPREPNTVRADRSAAPSSSAQAPPRVRLHH